MLINATLRTNKSEILQNKYIELINSGINPDEILVLCLNSYKKRKFIDAVGSKLQVSTSGKFNIQTFFGLCYNAVSDNWTVVENSINFGETAFVPNLCGLELSRMLLSKSITGENFCDYFSKTNLLHQLFKRIQLSVLNGLSDKDISCKSALLKESFSDDARLTYDNFRRLSLKYRSFDYLRQVSVLPFIVKNTHYFHKIKYLFLDDADEITFAEFDFIKNLLPGLEQWYIAYDKNGASRCGYLSAYKTAVFEFEKLERSFKLEKNDISSQNAELLYKNILAEKKTLLKNFEINSCIKRLDMLDEASAQINSLIKNGAKPSDILVITPIADDMLKSFCTSFPSQIISGSEKPKETRILRNAFTFLKIINPDFGLKIEPSDLKALFFDCLKIPQKYSGRAVLRCIEENAFIDYDFKNEKYQTEYDKLKNFASTCKKTSLSAELLAFFEYFSQNGISKQDLKKFNFFLKEVRSFEAAFGDLGTKEKKSIIFQFENGIISENPSIAQEIDDNAVIISTPQKVIDFEIKRKYHIWLDISSDLWTMRDTGVLYNAWVFNAEWKNRQFTFEDNIRLSREKNARVLRKIMLCCDEKVFAYFSQYDSSGVENFGIMPSYFADKVNNEDKKTMWKIVPREDQKPVVEYNGGYAAVNAVPGAGKTTILTALLIKLINSGIPPAGIFVLTYMESAASNIREKIKLALPNLNEMPNVSTIHGLAFRIIKENNNYVKLDLSDNIDIADDNTRQKIIRECISDLNLEHSDYDDYEKAVSAVKLAPSGMKSLEKLKNSKHFDKVYSLYEQKLRKAGVIDYDDMLRYAVKLVDEYPDIKKYYADLCSFVIEDEAQDSSELQQKLLLLLSSQNGNLLRIGDINQAITSSFTDSNPKCFKRYFDENTKMIMKSSQRSAVQIQKTANELIDFAKNNEFLKDTFFDSKLVAAVDNPITDKSPEFKIFDNLTEEKFYILNKLKENFRSSEKKSSAILLRSNYQINDWAEFLSQNGLSVVMRSDILEQKAIFKVILSFLKFLQSPLSNDYILDLMKVFNDCRVMTFSKEDFYFVKALKTPFIQENTDNFSSENLLCLWWNLQFNDDLSYSSVDVAALKIGLRFFSTKNEKANVYLIATIIKRLMATYNSQESVIEKLEQIAKRRIGSSFKFFDDENTENSFDVKLMTIHKSKGDEFDMVFIPELNEDNYPLTKEKVKLKSSFVESVRELRKNYKKRSTDDIKKELAEENLRLLYVGFTRAKKELYISCSSKNKYGKKITPSVLFDVFGGEIK